MGSDLKGVAEIPTERGEVLRVLTVSRVGPNEKHCATG